MHIHRYVPSTGHGTGTVLQETIAALERGYAKSKACNTTLALALANLLFKGKPQLSLSPSSCVCHISHHVTTVLTLSYLFVVHTYMPSLALSGVLNFILCR
jgi:hypothetical protein